MPTARTKAALHTLLADNTAGDIGADDVQDIVETLFVEVAAAQAGAAPVESIATEAGTTRSMADADAGRTIRCTNAAGCLVTIPAALTPGVTCTFIQEHATGQVAFVGSSLTLRFAAAFTDITAEQWSVAVVRILDTDEALLTGDLALV